MADKGGVADAEDGNEEEPQVGLRARTNSFGNSQGKEMTLDLQNAGNEPALLKSDMRNANKFGLASPSSPSYPEEEKSEKLSGWLKLAGLGFRKAVKAVWFIYGDDTGKLYYYRKPEDLLPLGEIDLRSSSLTYNAGNKDKPGLFEIRSDGKVYSVDATDRTSMLYWLNALQKKRRAFSTRQSHLAQDLYIGKNKKVDASGLLGRGAVESEVREVQVSQPESQTLDQPQRDRGWSLMNLKEEIRNAVSSIRTQLPNSVDKRLSSRSSGEWSLVEGTAIPLDFLQSANKPSNTQWHVPIDEGDDIEQDPSMSPEGSKSSSLQSLSGGQQKPESLSSPQATTNYSSSEQEQSQTDNTDSSFQPIRKEQMSSSNQRVTSPGPLSPTSSSSSSNGKSKKFMSVLRKKLNDAVKPAQQQSNNVTDLSSQQSQACNKCRLLADDLFSVKEDLKAAEEELQANREIVRLLQKEIEFMRAEINTRDDCEGKETEEIVKQLRQKDKHIVELEHNRAAMLEETSLLNQKIRLLESEIKELKEEISMFHQTICVKDEMIVSLTYQNQEYQNNDTVGGADVTDGSTYQDQNVNLMAMLEEEKKERMRLADTCRAYEEHNRFLSSEILELNTLRENDHMRERLLQINFAKLEAEYCQTKSRYLYLLNGSPAQGEESDDQEVINRLLAEALEPTVKPEDDIIQQTFISSQGEYDEYGFLKFGHVEDDALLSKANILQRQSMEIEYMLRDEDETRSALIRWENFMAGQTSAKHLTRSAELKALLRLGVPRQFREKIWIGCIGLQVHSTRQKLGENYYKDLLERAHNNRSSPAVKQIELDLLRTLPDNRFFEKMDSPGVRKLRRILLCYSVHNPYIGYCQGLNRLAAIALLFLCEEDAFWCLVAIVDHLMPSDYFTHTLAAAQADQRVLKDLVQERCPKLHSHLEMNEVDLSLFTFNWFLTIFVDGVLPELFLRIWDVFLYEGSKVLFRFALAFLKYAEDDILCQPNNLAINRYMRTLGENITDVKRIMNIAFTVLNPFPMRSINGKRHNHLQQVRTELDELEAIRRDFKSSHKEDRDESSRAAVEYYTDDELDEG